MKFQYRLGVNIDHVATIRNARGGVCPSVKKAALESIKAGADIITVHLREDQRHIKPKDVIELKKILKKPINLEMALTKKMINFAIKTNPQFVCIVPEKRKELTTEGGLNLSNNYKYLQKSIKKIQSKNIKVSLFINPNLKNIRQCLKLNVNAIEIHTGSYCNFLEKKNKAKALKEFNKIKKIAKFAYNKDLKVHCGHGLNYFSTKNLKKIKEIEEFNIGHFIISESIFYGLKSVVSKFNKIIKN